MHYTITKRSIAECIMQQQNKVLLNVLCNNKIKDCGMHNAITKEMLLNALCNTKKKYCWMHDAIANWSTTKCIMQ